MSARKYREDQEFVPNIQKTSINDESMNFGINSEDGDPNQKAPPTPQQIRQILAKKPKKVTKTIR